MRTLYRMLSLWGTAKADAELGPGLRFSAREPMK